MTTRHYILLLMTALTVMLIGCNHKELYVPEYGMRRVRVDFDFTNLSRQPAEMRVFFYRMQDDGSYGSVTRADLPAAGGYIDLQPGDYRVVARNADTENVLEQQGDGLADFQLTTPSYMVEEVSLSDFRNQQSAALQDSNGASADSTARRSPRHRTLFGTRVPVSPDEDWYMLYDLPDWTCCCPAADFRLAEGAANWSGSGSPGSSTEQLVLHAVSAVCTIAVEVRGIEGVKWADLSMGTLSGVAGSVRMSDALPTVQEAMVSFPLRADAERGVLATSFLVWGFSPGDRDDVRQQLNIYVWANTGNYYMSQDVTDVLRQAGRDGARSVVINMESDVNLMDAAQGNSGFRPTLGGWEEKGTNLPLW